MGSSLGSADAAATEGLATASTITCLREVFVRLRRATQGKPAGLKELRDKGAACETDTSLRAPCAQTWMISSLKRQQLLCRGDEPAAEAPGRLQQPLIKAAPLPPEPDKLHR